MREFKRKQGYLTLAQNGDTDYVRMAYGLALSLKATQTEVPWLTVCVDKGMKVPEKYLHAFDEVIEIPWGDDGKGFAWKIHNKWKAYYMTPYEETVLLDADMIFPTDVSEWWDTLADRNIWFTTQPATFRGDVITRNAYRQEFIMNSLPMVYTAFAYFKQSEEATAYFELLRNLFPRWAEMYEYYRFRTTPEDVIDAMKSSRSTDRFAWTSFLREYPHTLSGDLAYAMATKILGKDEEYAPEGMFPTFTHMKVQDQGFDGQARGEDWTQLLHWSLKDDLTLLVGNYVQRYPFHYFIKDWLTDEVLAKLERAANG